MLNREVLYAIGGSVVGVIGLAALRTAMKACEKADTSDARNRLIGEKLDRLYEKLNMSLNDIEKRSTIEISDSLIDSVVASMAERKLDRVVPGKVQAAVDGIHAESVMKIRNDIEKKVTEMTPEIESKLRTQLGAVSIDPIKTEIVEKAISSAKREVLDDVQRTKDHAIREIEEYEKKMEDEIEDKVEDIIDDLEDKAEDRFDEELDTLTTRYKSRLDDVSSIYASLANKIGS